MRVPLSWLSEFVPLGVHAGDAEGVARLRATFDSLGLVVEGIEHVGEGLDDVVLARVAGIDAIAGADRIRLVHVATGGEDLDIVCGAHNFAVGDVVALAPVGARLPGDFVISERRMRGVTSRGMLCSGRELGLSDDGAGLLIIASPGPDAPLPEGITLGARLLEHLGIEPDVVFDLAIEPNRPDALCIAGIARDVAARLKLSFTPPPIIVAEHGPPVGERAHLVIDEGAPARRVVGRVVEGVRVVSSPPVVARRLELCGMRPINAIVDASNYVMLEWGQPTHPYDLDHLGGSGLRIRLAHEDEELTTLDGVTRTLGRARDARGELVSVEDCLICDAEDVPVGIAGVMGGATTEIGPETTRVLLEVADFDPLAIGRTAARQGLRSEAFQRFWRGIDPAGLVRAADRFCELVLGAARFAGMPEPTVAQGVADVTSVGYVAKEVVVRPQRLNALLGTALSTSEVEALLSPIGFVATAKGDELVVNIPSWRPDASREVDVIEEVGRHFGYENIARRERRSPFVGQLSPTQAMRRELRALLRGEGAHEAMLSSIVDPTHERLAGSTIEHVVLSNPIVPAESVLRSHLLPGLLDALRHNADHRNAALRLFSIGHVFSAALDENGRPNEREHVGVVLALDNDDATTAVACTRAIFEGLGISPEELHWEQGASVVAEPLALGAHPSRSALVRSASGELCGVVGEVDPSVLSSFGLTGRVGWCCFDFSALASLPRETRRARPVSKQPSSDIDLAFALDDDTPAFALEHVLRKEAGELCESVTLVDVYRGAVLPAGTRSLSYRLRFCALDRTLTDAEVASIRARCIAAVESSLPAKLRS